MTGPAEWVPTVAIVREERDGAVSRSPPYLSSSWQRDAATRAEREAERQAKAEELERLLAPAGLLGKLSEKLEGLVTETLESAGYHQHRGEWRRATTWGKGGR